MEKEIELAKKFMDAILYDNDFVNRYSPFNEYVHYGEYTDKIAETLVEPLKRLGESFFDDDKMNSFLISKGYNGIIYDISMKNTSNKLTKEKNVVIFDENCIEIVNCEKVYFDGAMKLDLK